MTQSIVGLFNTFTEANAARQTLVKEGFSPQDILVNAHEGDMPAGSTDRTSVTDDTQGGGGFMASVENFFSNLFGGADADNAGHYSEAVRRGGAVVTVNVQDESKVDTVR